MAIAYEGLSSSTYLDFTGYRSNGSLPTNGRALTDFTVNVALTLKRVEDPTALLASDWATRQATLSELEANGQLWSKYGASQEAYNATRDTLHDLGFTTLGDATGSDGYISSAESRTIWVSLDAAKFHELFNTTLQVGATPKGETWFWEGSLSLPKELTQAGVTGLWFDSGGFQTVLADPGQGTEVTLPQGWQSPGNAAAKGSFVRPQDVAQLYDFPLAGQAWNAAETGAIGVIEPGLGSALSGNQTLVELLNQYRHKMGIHEPVDLVAVQPAGTIGNASGERSLDIGIATAVNPKSPLILYAGSGPDTPGGRGNTLTAYYQSIWDTVNDPAVLTSSFGYQEQTARGSPFWLADHELFVDAALRGISFFQAAGDGGSGELYGNGLTNVSASRSSMYSVMVGGTSLSTLSAAMTDETLTDIVQQAMAGDRATLWQLVAGGLTEIPEAADQAAWLVETIWNRYHVEGQTIAAGPNGTGYLSNNTGAGGVDSSQPTPWYQTAFGLSPLTADPQHLPGRGMPDVSVNAGGNMFYITPNEAMTGTFGADGTSAASPFWASLAVQINAVFHDQGLPNLGYMNDLLYIAAAIAPGSFNDVTLGNNVSSFVYGGDWQSDGAAITPTGFGYYSGPGYDLTSGLGSPNGTLLARALTAIGHEQMYFADEPDLVVGSQQSGWQSAAEQSVLVQVMSGDDVSMTLSTGSDGFGFYSTAAESYAWTSRLAQQSLQDDLDPKLVRLFDKQGHGMLGEVVLSAGESLAVHIDGVTAQAIQAGLTSDFGFADFSTSAGAVRIARAVAVAETAGGGNDQVAIVRVRQNGEDSLSLSFYRVDDLGGAIDGLHPGEAGYAAAAQARAYHTTMGSTSIDGPGYGNYMQAGLLDVDAGDLIAMTLTNNTSGTVYWAFASANEAVDGRSVGHLWNYGANSWGWEDTLGGGDHDFNDLIVGLDFTSASGHGWLV
jgi:hypothetical protein